MSEKKPDSDSLTTIRRLPHIHIHIHFDNGDNDPMSREQIGKDIPDALERYPGIGGSIKHKEEIIS